MILISICVNMARFSLRLHIRAREFDLCVGVWRAGQILRARLIKSHLLKHDIHLKVGRPSESGASDRNRDFDKLPFT